MIPWCYRALHKMPYKLYYFNARGGAEVTRIAFALGNIPYEDIRLEPEQWAEEKASGRPPFGQMPFLEFEDGTIISQSGAIARFACGLAGYAPTDLVEKAVADMIFDSLNDIRTEFGKVFFEKDETKKEELKKNLYEKTIPTRLGNFNKCLEANNGGKGFFAGDKMSYADIYFFHLFNGRLADGELKVPEQLKPFPLLVDLYNRVMNVPKIKAWIEQRPKTFV